tara:strand:- start:453 stop:743 length:291 start_codon:yes stop_codon:yes gene_type:complete
MMKDNIGLGIGQVMVTTTHNRGHDPEFWAEQTTNRICGISEQAAPHIKEQALAFRTAVYNVILAGMRSAIASDRVTVSNKLKEIGHGDVAKFLKEL